MQFPRPSLLALHILLLAGGTACAQSYSNGIAAVVNGKPITKSELRDNIKASEQIIMMNNQNDPVKMKRELAELQANALDALIDREVILVEFAKVGGVIKPQYVDDQINNIIREAFKGDRDALVTELAKAGMSMKKFRDLQEKMIIANAMRAKQAGEPSPATPKEVEDYYRKNVDKWRVGDQVKISTITIPKFSGETGETPESQKKLAQEIRAKIVGGADFATTARAYSQDSRAEFGGAWEWMPRTELMPAIANTAMELKVGGVSQVLEQETSYIIVSCDAKKLGEAPPLEKVRGDIQKMIQQEKSKQAVDEWMQLLRKKAVIRKF
ncbi:MAG: peptidylprolyl isomerase [Verrucomicrobiaceae bacterium]|nr:peptidylprolyl isomerase [Verrucomicrobiaceae bacterium]